MVGIQYEATKGKPGAPCLAHSRYSRLTPSLLSVRPRPCPGSPEALVPPVPSEFKSLIPRSVLSLPSAGQMLLEWTTASMPECCSPPPFTRRLLHHMSPPPGSLPDPSGQGHILLFGLGFRLVCGTQVCTFRAQAVTADRPSLAQPA